MKVITYDQNIRHYILKVFGLYVGNDGFVYDEDTGEDVLGLDGYKVLITDFAGMVNTENGPRIVRAGLIGAIELLDHQSRATA